MTARVALVTGAASGIGAACAAELAQTHDCVVLADLHPAGEAVMTAVETAGARAVAVVTDVRDESEVVELVRLADREGRLVSAVNSAGVGGPSQPVGEYSLTEWRAVLDVNLTGVFVCLREEVRAMAAHGGSIVNVSSVLGHGAGAQAPAYTAAKHGVEGLSRSAALAYAVRGIRVNTVVPGFVDTELLRSRRTEAEQEALAARHPIGRLATAAEVSRVVAFLCSEAASFVTGSSYRVDGGFLADT